MIFYSQYTNNWGVNRAIISYAHEYEVPVHVAFAIAWQESQFNPNAVSPRNNNGSRDWGLFQINDGYRNWTREDFLDIEKNVEEGIKHFKWCYDQSGDIIAALQAYNAGMSRVVNGTVPDRTMDYVDKILHYESILDEAWNAEFQI